MMKIPPILNKKEYQSKSVFTAQNLLREARRQKSLSEANVPKICVLDPDGDIVRFLTATEQANADPNWACYHTTLYTFSFGRRTVCLWLRAARQHHLIGADHGVG